MEGIKKALVLGAHPDDGEFGCGGTIAKLTGQGVEVWYAVFSPCDKSLPGGFDKGTLFTELNNAAVHLGIIEDHIITHDFPVREFPAYRQEILERLIQLKKDIAPDLVLVPNSNDVHQDHGIIHDEGVRAFKRAKLLGYELPWNNLSFNGNFHVQLEEKHIEAKIKAISEYKSQEFRPYDSPDLFKGLAKVRGTQGGMEHAEAFEAIHWSL